MNKHYKRLYRACAVLVAFLSLLFALGAGLLIADGISENYARVLPSYAREEINEIVFKEEWSEEDYRTLYLQTGLGKSALDSYKDRRAMLLAFQDALFYRGEVTHVQVSFTTKQDKMRSYSAPLIDLQPGDVLVSSSCHTYGWRNGHAALAVSPVTLLESMSPGTPSRLSTSGVNWFRSASNFIVLRLKPEAVPEGTDVISEGKRIAELARETLVNVPYSLVVGVFTKKDLGRNPKATHCSHLVWQAFRNCGYDIDANGGGICLARDISRSPLFEVVQVYGFDPVTLW